MTEGKRPWRHVLALVPARSGSTRLPGKNLAEVAGVTLVGRSVRVARAVAEVDEVLVSSDAEDILEEALRHGAVIDLRAPSLATATTPTRDVIDDLLARRPDIDALLVLQPTSPLRQPNDVRACLFALLHHPTAATVCAVDHPTRWTVHLSAAGLLQPVSGEWSATAVEGPAEFRLNGAVYAARADHLRSGGPLVGPETAGVEMPRARSVDVDDAYDLHVARLLAAAPFLPADEDQPCTP